MTDGICPELGQRGSAAVLSLIVAALLGMAGIACFMLSLTEHDIALGHGNGITAQYLAEAGVQHALVRLKTDPWFAVTSGSAKVTLNSTGHTSSAGTYQVIVTGSGDSRTITSVGIAAQAKRQLVVTLDVVSPANGKKQAEILITAWKNQN